MNVDRLFLLKPDFQDGGQHYYCPHSAQLEGVLSFYPQTLHELRMLSLPVNYRMSLVPSRS